MKAFVSALVVLVVSACDPEPVPAPHVVASKFCANVCVNEKLKLVAGDNSASGTLGSAIAVRGGTSGVLGLAKQFRQECDELYGDQKCCVDYWKGYALCAGSGNEVGNENN